MVVVVCVGFLLVLLVVGVLKMRDTPAPLRRHRRARRSQVLLKTEFGAKMFRLESLDTFCRRSRGIRFTEALNSLFPVIHDRRPSPVEN